MLRCQQLLNLRILKIVVLRGGGGSQESVLIKNLSVVLRVWEGRKETPFSGSIAYLLLSELSGLRDKRRLLRQISYDTSICVKSTFKTPLVVDVKQSWKGCSFSGPEKQVVLKQTTPSPLPPTPPDLLVLNFFFLFPPLSSHLPRQYAGEAKKGQFWKLCVCTVWDSEPSLGALDRGLSLPRGTASKSGAACCSLLPPGGIVSQGTPGHL